MDQDAPKRFCENQTPESAKRRKSTGFSEGRTGQSGKRERERELSLYNQSPPVQLVVFSERCVKLSGGLPKVRLITCKEADLGGLRRWGSHFLRGEDFDPSVLF